MRRYRYEIDNARAHLRSLWAVIGLEAQGTPAHLILRFQQGEKRSDMLGARP